jgi:D-3-phosphoglycerate dehydrogenase / 2-oxoglutarate reductase
MKLLANDGIDETGKALLEKAGFVVVTENVAQENLVEAINRHGFVAITVRSATQVRKELIDSCPNLKLIGRGGVGMDNIDVDYARSVGIEVVNTPAASSYSVAELVMAHMFAMSRFIYDSNREMPANGLTKFGALKKKYAGGIELRGKTIGIIGCGRIGQAVAKYALGIGMNVVYYDPFWPSINVNIDFFDGSQHTIILNSSTFDETISVADFITLHVPGGEILTAESFKKMKDGVCIVNTARGGAINETDLIEALNSGKVAHAALDVFKNEPTPSEDLLKHRKISLTPHIGAATLEAQERIGIELAEKIIYILKK